MIVSTVDNTGRRMLSSEIFIRRRDYSTTSSLTGRSVRSCSVPEVISVSPTFSPLDNLNAGLGPQAGLHLDGLSLSAFVEIYLVHAISGTMASVGTAMASGMSCRRIFTVTKRPGSSVPRVLG